MTDSVIELYRRDFRNVLERWNEALRRQPEDEMARDSAILRFELAFEVSWKLLQQLGKNEGFEVNSPRQAFQRAFLMGLIEDEEIWKDILLARNTAVHVYRQEFADALLRRLPAFFNPFPCLKNGCVRLGRHA